MHQNSSTLGSSYQENVVNMVPGTVFTTIHYLSIKLEYYIRLGKEDLPGVTLHQAEDLLGDKHSSLLGLSISHQENEVLRTWAF